MEMHWNDHFPKGKRGREGGLKVVNKTSTMTTYLVTLKISLTTLIFFHSLRLLKDRGSSTQLAYIYKYHFFTLISSHEWAMVKSHGYWLISQWIWLGCSRHWERWMPPNWTTKVTCMSKSRGQPYHIVYWLRGGQVWDPKPFKIFSTY